MACCLNQCWLIISEVLWHSPENNFTAIVQSIILYNKFENYTFKIIVTFPRGQWVEYLAVFGKGELQIDGSVQDCSNSNALSNELLRSCTKSLRWKCPMIYIVISCLLTEIKISFVFISFIFRHNYMYMKFIHNTHKFYWQHISVA